MLKTITAVYPPQLYITSVIHNFVCIIVYVYIYYQKQMYVLIENKQNMRRMRNPSYDLQTSSKRSK